MRKPYKYTKERLQESVLRSKSWADMCREFEVKPFTGAQTHIAKVTRYFGIDTSHFTGQAWNRGKTYPKKELKEYLNNTGPSLHSHNLKKRLIKEGVKEGKCEACGLDKWMNRDIPLELDHINGEHFDNRLENLRILCPNCHAQTETYCKKKAN